MVSFPLGGRGDFSLEREGAPPLVYPFSQSYNLTPNAFFCSFQVSVQNVQSSLDLHQPEYSNIDQHRDNQKFDSAFVWTQGQFKTFIDA